MDDYLEKLFADAYRRELDQEESIVRSLPFIAALAGLTLLGLREFADAIPAFDGSSATLLVHGLLISIGVTFAYVAVQLFLAVAKRGYRYTEDELAIREKADKLLEFYLGERMLADEAEGLARRDLREAMIEQWASCASNNRQQNTKRQAASSRAFNCVIAALALAFLFSATTYIMTVVDEVETDRNGMIVDGADQNGKPAD